MQFTSKVPPWQTLKAAPRIPVGGQAAARFGEFEAALDQMDSFLPPLLRPLLVRATLLHLFEVSPPRLYT